MRNCYFGDIGYQSRQSSSRRVIHFSSMEQFDIAMSKSELKSSDYIDFSQYMNTVKEKEPSRNFLFGLKFTGF